MAKITLPIITSGYNLTKLNEALQQIQDEFNDKVLYRDNPVGEDNALSSDIDFDSQRVLNLPEPLSESEPVRKSEWDSTVGAAEDARDAAQEAQAETEELLLSRGDLRNTGVYQVGFDYLVSDILKASSGDWYLTLTPFTSTVEATDIASGNLRVWQGIALYEGNLTYGIHDTLAGAKSRTDLVDNPANPVRIYINERQNFFIVKSGLTPNEKDIIAAANSLQLELEDKRSAIGYGLDTASVSDQGELLQHIFDTTLSPIFPKTDAVVVTSQIDVRHGTEITTTGELVIDGSQSAFDTSNGNNVINVGEDVSSALPAGSGAINKGVFEITFTADHGLTDGDIICIADPTDFSWNSSRAEYKKGEFARVADVISTTQITLSGPTLDGYGSGTYNLFKMTMGTFDIKGQLTVLSTQSSPAGFVVGVEINNVFDSDISGLKSVGKDAVIAALQLVKCYNVSGKGLTATQDVLSGTQNDYGLSVVDSQHIYLEGYFSASRHGVTLGVLGGTAYPVCRDIQLKGTFKTTGEGDVQAANAHGNCEDILWDGLFYGGVTIGGKANKVNGKVYGDSRGICVLGAEVNAFNHDLSGVSFSSQVNPSLVNRGIIDFGGNSVFESDNMEGGTLDLSDIKVETSFASIDVRIDFNNTNVSSDDLFIDLSGAQLNVISDGASRPVRIENSGGARSVERVDIDGLLYNAGELIITADNLYTNRQSGIAAYAGDTGANTVVVDITYPQKYPNGYVPRPKVSLEIQSIGPFIGVIEQLKTNTGFRARIFTLDGANFGNTNAQQLSWTVE